MTLFDIAVPLAALVTGIGLALYIRFAARRFDEKHKDRHPAE